MKFISILKAIASGLIWGLGQLLNGQFLKALFFLLFFGLFVTIEYTTSDYFGETDPYDYIEGNDFTDDYFGVNGFLADYLYNSGQLVDAYGNPVENPDAKDPYLPFEEFIVEIGGYENFNEQYFVEFMARDLKASSPITYTNIKSLNSPILLDDIDDTSRVRIYTVAKGNQSLWAQKLSDDPELNDYIYFAERTRDIDGVATTEYVEITVLTNEYNENNIRTSRDGLVRFEKLKQIKRVAIGANAGYYLPLSIDGETKYLNIETEKIISITGIIGNVNTEGPIYKIGDEFYAYYEPGIYFDGVPLQYKPTSFSDDFRQSILNTYSLTFNRYTNKDYTRLMIKVALELNPDLKETFVTQYDNFYYEKAGIFLKGFWSVSSLGVAEKVTFNQQRALELAMIGGTYTNGTTTPFLLSGKITYNEELSLLGHVTLFLLIEGLISIILFSFFLIILVWSARDAYKVAEQKRLKMKVEKDIQYFKDVYESSFEYIILFPAIFVLGFISIMPIAFGFLIAFTNIKGGESQNDLFNWVGFDNFLTLFNFAEGLGSSFGEAFWRVLGWTVVWAIFSTFTVFFGGFIQALILNSEKVVFRKLWRTILILPWAIPALLSQMVFSVMFNENGFINTFLYDIGVINILQDLGILGVNFNDLSGIMKFFYLGPGDKIQWFSNPYNKTFVRTTLIVVNIWLGFPYFMALMTGVMTAIDKTLYEAADIDGANGFQKITQITMPLVLYSTAPILIMTFSGNFNNFGVIYFITNGGPNTGKPSLGYAGDTDILISWMYKLTVDYSIYNMASVFSVLIFLFVGSVTAWNLSRTRAFQED